MKISKEIIQSILYTQYTEQDYDRETGPCESLYTISNLFHDAQFGEYAIEKILEAYAEVMCEKVDRY